MGSTETLTDGALARAPEPESADAFDTNAMRDAVAKALAADGHGTASTLLGSGTWTQEGTALRIEVAGMSKKMITLTVNTAAERIIRQELQKLGAPTRFMVVPGAAGAASSGGHTMAAAPAGSVQEAALANPLVKSARSIFEAEVRSVVDLRPR